MMKLQESQASSHLEAVIRDAIGVDCAGILILSCGLWKKASAAYSLRSRQAKSNFSLLAYYDLSDVS